jgi:hypothetical protein
VDKIVDMCFLCSGIPFSIGKNNPFYHAMFNIVALGPRYKVVTYDELKGEMLQTEKKIV